MWVFCGGRESKFCGVLQALSRFTGVVTITSGVYALTVIYGGMPDFIYSCYQSSFVASDCI